MNRKFSRRLVTLAILAGSLCAAAALQAQGTAAVPVAGKKEPLEKLTLSINPAQLSYLPLFLAIDKGYFKDAGLDLNVITYKGSSTTQMPLLARGDVDISTVVAGPALFNQVAAGFNIKLIAALTEPRKGYKESVVLMVRKDVWDSGAVRNSSDLKGKKIDGSALGNPIDFLLKQAMLQAGLKATDVQLAYRTRSPADFEQIMRQKLADVAGVSEPTATQIESLGLAVKWKSYVDVIPWYQETYLSASEAVVKDRPQAVNRFLVGYLRAVQDMSSLNGKWTPELLQTASKWTGMSTETLGKIGGTPYWSPIAAINVDSLTRVQKYWVSEGLVKQPASIEKLVDTGSLNAAIKKNAIK
jgi:NitT/TauT family transport system substrate-binding protein